MIRNCIYKVGRTISYLFLSVAFWVLCLSVRIYNQRAMYRVDEEEDGMTLRMKYIEKE